MTDSQELEHRLLERIMQVPIIDVHSHVPAEDPYARSLRDLLGYHYYTELAHSAGMDRQVIAPDRPDEEMIPRLLEAMQNIDNTVQYGWMIDLARELFDFDAPELTPRNWERLDEAVRRKAQQQNRARRIMDRSNIEKVFLTNSFEEDLERIDTTLFVPSLRADRLVFELVDADVRASLEEVSGISIADVEGLKHALGEVVEKFRSAGAKSLAISLPPNFGVLPVTDGDFETALQTAMRGEQLTLDTERILNSGLLIALAELCADYELPFQIMYGALRGAYEHGVPQGTDLPHSGDTVHGLLPLLNAFPQVTFCLSVLNDGQIQELNSYGWIVQNVVLSGHWWYLNVPAYIERDLAARIQSTPKNKLIGYYSDMYKLEFGLAKFGMYRRVLARVLARDFVEPGYGDEAEAEQMARMLLNENPARIFRL